MFEEELAKRSVESQMDPVFKTARQA
jgi:hypothetical protein